MVDTSRGVWAFTADVDLLRRLAASGFDWVALDAQHGPVDRAALHAAGRGLADAGTALVVRVPAVDPVWIGAALDAGATAVVVPSVTGTADAVLAARASRYPPEGERSWGPFAPAVGRRRPRPGRGERRGAVPGSWSRRSAPWPTSTRSRRPRASTACSSARSTSPSRSGTTVDGLLDDRSAGNPLGRVVAAAPRHGILVAGFAGTPANARRLRAHGIQCLAVTTDVAVVAEGPGRCSRPTRPRRLEVPAAARGLTPPG